MSLVYLRRTLLLLIHSLLVINLAPCRNFFYWSQESERLCMGYYRTCIKVVSDLRQVGSFPRLFWFSPPIKLLATIYSWNMLKVTLYTINLTLTLLQNVFRVTHLVHISLFLSRLYSLNYLIQHRCRFPKCGSYRLAFTTLLL
jgi:hypothetical protein